MADDVEHVFVYGTLVRGGPNHDRFCAHALTVEPATTTGTLHGLPMGYPALVDAGDDIVHGEAMTFEDLASQLGVLDRLEGYRPGRRNRSLYLRCTRPIVLVRSRRTVLAHCYIWNRALPTGSRRLPSGRWRPRRQAR